ncbi:hypothetical protein ACF0H5_013284 [Mactra antiquata]
MEKTFYLCVLFIGVGLIIGVVAKDNLDIAVENANNENVDGHDDVNAKSKHSPQLPADTKVTENEKPDVNSKTTDNKNVTNVNNTSDNDMKGAPGWYQKVVENKGMLMRTFYVLIGVTSIVVIYFVIRAWRTRRRHNKSRKYGLITSSGADLEMEPLDQDNDDDDEMTMFERRR